MLVVGGVSLIMGGSNAWDNRLNEGIKAHPLPTRSPIYQVVQ